MALQARRSSRYDTDKIAFDSSMRVGPPRASDRPARMPSMVAMVRETGTIGVLREWFREACDRLDYEARQEMNKKRLSTGWESWNGHRQMLMVAFEHPFMNLVVGAVIVFNVVIVAVESSTEAACISSQRKGTGPEVCPENDVCYWINVVLMVFYTLEIALKFFTMRWSFFHSGANNADLLINIGGMVDLFLASVLPGMQIMKMFRILRLIRTIRILNLFPELSSMISGFLNALAAMVWGFCMIIILLCIWSVIAVEMVHPRNVDVDHNGDTFCEEAFGTVENSIILFFQTLVAGDSWGRCVIPIIMTYPTMLPVFSGSFVCIQLGFMNLILSVIVDKSADSREQKKSELQAEKADREREAVDKLLQVCADMDTDGSGTISYDEVLEAYATNAELQRTLDDLNIAEEDLRDLFSLADDDGSGLLTYKEFVKTVQCALQMDAGVLLMTLRLELNRGILRLQKLLLVHEATEEAAEGADGRRPPSGVGDGAGPTKAAGLAPLPVQGGLDMGKGMDLQAEVLSKAAPEQAGVATSAGHLHVNDMHLLEQVQASVEEWRSIGSQIDMKFEDLKVQTLKHLAALKESFQQLQVNDVVSETTRHAQLSSSGLAMPAGAHGTAGPTPSNLFAGAAATEGASFGKMQASLSPMMQPSPLLLRPPMHLQAPQVPVAASIVEGCRQPAEEVLPVAVAKLPSAGAAERVSRPGTMEVPTSTALPPSKSFRKHGGAEALLQTAEASGWVCAIATGRGGTSIAIPGLTQDHPDIGRSLSRAKDVPESLNRV